MKREPVKVVQDEDKPVAKEVLAQAITRISESLEKLRKSGLNRPAIIALVKDDTGVPKSTITTVLDSLEHLKRNYT